MANVQYRGTGRRKSSVARVILTPGTGNIVINDKPAKEYLPSDVLLMIVNQPLELTNTTSQFDVSVNVYGGGYSGQAGAIRHGISSCSTILKTLIYTNYFTVLNNSKLHKAPFYGAFVVYGCFKIFWIFKDK